MAGRRDSANPEIENELLSQVPDDENLLPDDGVDDGVDDQDAPDDQVDEVDGDQPEPKVDERGQPIAEQPVDFTKEQIRFDAKGNVIDKNGKVIAAAGRERRLDEQNRRFKAVLDDQSRQVSQLRSQLAEREYLSGIPQKLNLTSEETAIGLDLVALFKSDPEKAVTTVLAEAVARGVDLNKVLGQTGHINTQAITQLLNQRLGPIDQQMKQRQQAEVVHQEATRRYNSFLASYPDAVNHQDAIANLMREGKARDETVAYLMLREFAVRNQLNFDAPLGPQLQGLMQQRQQPPQRQQRQTPMINGRPVGHQVAPRETAVASPDRSFASIVDEALNEAGIR